MEGGGRDGNGDAHVGAGVGVAVGEGGAGVAEEAEVLEEARADVVVEEELAQHLRRIQYHIFRMYK